VDDLLGVAAAATATIARSPVISPVIVPRNVKNVVTAVDVVAAAAAATVEDAAAAVVAAAAALSATDARDTVTWLATAQTDILPHAQPPLNFLETFYYTAANLA